MPRQARKKSESGIYHIMLRGINQQQIFEDEEDNAKFIQVLKDCKAVSEFQILSYCLMGNHVHLLLKIEKEPIGQVFKRICGRYVYWYNVKYQRVGHLFQDRFKSEPVEDDAYLLTVIRYIHQNPVKAGLSSSVGNYKWSSYSEYFKDNTFINTSFVLSMISIGQFKKLNNEYLDITCLDIDDSKKLRMTDEQAKILIECVSGCSNIGEFQELEPVKRNVCLREFAQSGMSIRQISRLTGISFGIVDGEGNVVAKYRYGAYGNIIYSTGDLAAINPIRYRGYYYDAETNCYYLQSRYYNPEWCRFISPDCLFIAGDAINGSNMYAYCNNNPVKYIDTSGAASETNKIDLKPVANGIRIISGSISKLISEATSGLFSLITDPILTKLTNCFNKRFGANATPEENRTFANSYFMTFIGTPILCIGSLTVLPLLDLIIDPGQKFPESPEFELPTGIRHFTPWSMEFLSGYATYFLGFESDGGEKTYITNPNKFMWQSMVGYNWFYDYFFSLGGPIEKIVLPFEAPATNLFPDASYAVWCWKADYWNLGAGAEIGIYWQPIKALAERGFYRIDQENLLVDVNMQVTYDHSEDELSPDNHTEVLHGNGEQHLSLKQTSWWITNFTPKIQFVDLDALNVCQAVNFAESGIHSNLYEAFYEKYSNDDTHPELSWSVSEPQWEYLNFDSEYPYEFYLQY